MSHTDVIETIQHKLEKAAVAAELAGAYRAHGQRPEGESYTDAARREREEALDLIIDTISEHVPETVWGDGNQEEEDELSSVSLEDFLRALEQAADAIANDTQAPDIEVTTEEEGQEENLADLPREVGSLILVHQHLDTALGEPIRARRWSTDDNPYPWATADHTERFPDGHTVASNEEITRWEILKGGPKDDAKPALDELEQGTRIRVFEANRYSLSTSTEGIIFVHDGSREGDLPWCREDDPDLGSLGPYYNSEEINRWEIVKPDAPKAEPEVKLTELEKGARIRVYEATRFSTATSDEGAIFVRDGDPEGDRPWCRSTENAYDVFALYYNADEINRWELISR